MFLMRSARLPLAALVFAAVALSACDSTDLAETNVDGTYAVTTYTFTPTATAIPPVNVRNRLDVPNTSMTFAGSSRSYVLIFRFAAEAAQYLVSGRYTTSGSTGVVVAFSGTDRRRLLLPAEVTFRYDEAAHTLTYQGALLNVNLAEYDAQQYGGLNSVDGTLAITLTRR